MVVSYVENSEVVDKLRRIVQLVRASRMNGSQLFSASRAACDTKIAGLIHFPVFTLWMSACHYDFSQYTFLFCCRQAVHLLVPALPKGLFPDPVEAVEPSDDDDFL